MAEEIVKLRFHHKGKFQQKGYVGGEETIIVTNPDLLSLPVLMEFVKDDLKYTEIGGVYRRNAELGQWELLKTDAQLCKMVDTAGNGGHVDFYIDNVVDKKMQPLLMLPHVLVRPRPNILAGVTKRMYVTSHELQQQKRNKKSILGCSPRRSPRLTKQQVENPDSTEVTSRQKSMPVNKQKEVSDKNLSSTAYVRRKLDVDNLPDEDEITDENMPKELDLPPPPPAMTEYERMKMLNVIRNNEIFLMHNLPALATGLREEFKKKKGKETMEESKKDMAEETDQDYIPEDEEHSEDETLKKPKKKTKKAEKIQLNTGPRTRSKANDLTATDKDAIDKEAQNPPKVGNAVQLPLQGPGSMLAYHNLRNRKEKDNGNCGTSVSGTANQAKAGDAVQGDDSPLLENEEVEEEAPVRRRGKTTMDKVHTRSVLKRVVIGMNDKHQPVADDDKTRAELGSFLGTLRRCVSLSYKNWSAVPKSLKATLWNYVQQRYIIPDELEKYCLESIRDSWRGCKSRIETNHYKKYQTDEERLENRPDDIPLEEFKQLLVFWADPHEQKKAVTNTENRKCYTDTHTAGPVSFAQIRKKMPEASDAEVFLKTRKRNSKNEYKSNTAVLNYRLEKIEKAVNTGEGSSNIDDLVTDGKTHGPSWLIGRTTKSAEVSTPPATNTYIQELTSQIRQALEVEIEAKVKKDVQEEVDSKLAMVLKKLSEANPNLQINLGDLCATISSDNDNGTPLTRDASS